jgi:putative flippase GtrA
MMGRDHLRQTAVQFLRFGIIGVLGFGVDYGFFHLGLDVLGLGHYFSAIFSFPFAVTFTWLGNRWFTFRGQGRKPVHEEWARFFAVCAIGFFLNRGTYALTVSFIPLAYAYPVLGLLAGTAAGMFFNFFFSKKLVFR